MTYHFDVEHAQRYGVNEAIFLANVIFWLRKNRANGKHRYPVQEEHHPDLAGQERTWTFNSRKAYVELFPFWTEEQIRRVTESLLTQGVLLKGQHSEEKWDRTLWYALRDESLLQLGKPANPSGENTPMQLAKNTNAIGEANRAFGENPRAITDSKRTDSKRSDSSVPPAPGELFLSEEIPPTPTARSRKPAPGKPPALSPTEKAGEKPKGPRPNFTYAESFRRRYVALYGVEPTLARYQARALQEVAERRTPEVYESMLATFFALNGSSFAARTRHSVACFLSTQDQYLPAPPPRPYAYETDSEGRLLTKPPSWSEGEWEAFRRAFDVSEDGGSDGEGLAA